MDGVVHLALATIELSHALCRGAASNVGNIEGCRWGEVADNDLFQVVLEFPAPAGVA